MKDFEINFTAEVVFMKKIPLFTLSIEVSSTMEDYDVEDSRYSERIKIMIEDYNPEEWSKEK